MYMYIYIYTQGEREREGLVVYHCYMLQCNMVGYINIYHNMYICTAIQTYTNYYTYYTINHPATGRASARCGASNRLLRRHMLYIYIQRERGRYTYMYIYIYVCTYIHIYIIIQREREIERVRGILHISHRMCIVVVYVYIT